MDIKQLAEYLKSKFLQQEVTGIELVVALTAMAKDGKITEKDIKDILFEVFNNNAEGIMRTLAKASEIMHPEMLDSIVHDVKEALPYNG